MLSSSQILSSYVDLTSPVLRRQEDLYSQYKFTCKCEECQPARRKTDPRRAFRCARKGCKGILPLQGKSQPISHLTFSKPSDAEPLPSSNPLAIHCPLCQTVRTVHLEADGQNNLGLRWALEQATFQLDIKDPLAFEGLRESLQQVC